MSDLIYKQAVIEALEKVAELFPWRVPGNRDSYDKYNEAWNDAIGRAEIEIEELPSAQPERKEGKWNVYYHGINEMPMFSYSCNQCGYSAPYGLYGGKYSQKKWNFCPNCGAKMRGEQG